MFIISGVNYDLFSNFITMKALVKERDLKQWLNCNLYAFWYCEIDELLRYETPIYYTTGIYGWKCDVYKIEHPETLDYVRISTGYWPVGQKVDYEKTRELEQQARKMSNASVWNYEHRKRRNRIALYRLCKGYK